jgi:hypothetical protein
MALRPNPGDSVTFAYNLQMRHQIITTFSGRIYLFVAFCKSFVRRSGSTIGNSPDRTSGGTASGVYPQVIEAAV